MRRASKIIVFLIQIVVSTTVIFAFTPSAKAEKGITISAGSSNLEVDKFLDVPIYIDTGTDAINAIGFTVNFPTENLEGLLPNRAESAFTMWVTESATRIDCGIPGQTGFTGKGLVTTLRFKGRTAGTANVTLSNIKVLFAGSTVPGFASNEISILVWGSAAPPEDVAEQQDAQKLTLKPPSLTAETPPSTPASSVTQATIPIPGASTTFGSLAQVSGQKGATAEEPLKPAEVVEAAVKGIFSKDSLLWSSILPTVLLLIIIIFLGIKLYLSERNRHIRMEHLLDKQLGTLAALESKIEIVEQRGAEGREQYIKELQIAKAEVTAEASGKKPELSEAKTV